MLNNENGYYPMESKRQWAGEKKSCVCVCVSHLMGQRFVSATVVVAVVVVMNIAHRKTETNSNEQKKKMREK